jgi:uncharacterized membrane protein
MNILLAILVLTFGLIVGAGWVFFQHFQPKTDSAAPKAAATPKQKVRWSYFILPVIILLISLITTAFFYNKLPDPVNLRPDSDTPATITRFMAMLWAIVPQLLMALIAMVITWGTGKISNLFAEAAASGVKLETVLMVMSNMVVIPQLVLLVAMINIFSYNSFQTHVSFVWWASLAVIFTGIILLSIFFVRSIQKMSAKNK